MSDTPSSPGPEQPTSRGMSRLVVLAAVVGGLALLALVLVVTLRDPVAYPPDSPEATVQAFLQSVADGDPDTSLLASECRRLEPWDMGDQRLRVVIVDSETTGQEATIDLSVTQSYGGMLDDGYDHDETYRLTRTADGWLIDGFDWPWGGCAGLFDGEG